MVCAVEMVLRRARRSQVMIKIADQRKIFPYGIASSNIGDEKVHHSN